MSAASGSVTPHAQQSPPSADLRSVPHLRSADLPSTPGPPSKSGRRSAPWGAPDLILLLTLIRAGHDAATIAPMLGRTENAVAAAAHRFVRAEEDVTQSDAISWLRACLPGTEDAAWLPRYRKRVRRQTASPAVAYAGNDIVAAGTDSAPATPVRSVAAVDDTPLAGLDHVFRNPQTAAVINEALRSFRQPAVAAERRSPADRPAEPAARRSPADRPAEPAVDALDLETAWPAEVIPIIELPQLVRSSAAVDDTPLAGLDHVFRNPQTAAVINEALRSFRQAAVAAERPSPADQPAGPAMNVLDLETAWPTEVIPSIGLPQPVVDVDDVAPVEDAAAVEGVVAAAQRDAAPHDAVTTPYRPRHGAAVAGGRPRCDVQDVAHGLSMALDTLHDRLGPMLTWRLGLRGTPPATLQEIAEKFLLSREGVRDLQLTALDQLAEAARHRGTLNASVAAAVQSWLGDGDPNGALAELAEDLYFERVPPVGVETLLALAGHGREERLVRLREFAEWQQQRNRQVTEAPVGLTRHSRVNTKIAGWFGAATWPAATVPPAALPPWNDSVDPTSGTGLAGDFRSAKLGRDVRYASQLELTILGQLERSSLVAAYVEQPLAIEFTWTDCGCEEHDSARTGCRRTYRPDVVFQHADGRVVLAEIKPVSHFGFSLARAESEAGRRFAHERGWGWVQLGPDGHVADLAGAPLRENVLSALDAALQGRGCLRWGDVLQLRLATPLTSVEVAAYAVQRNLRFLDRPYQLVD